MINNPPAFKGLSIRIPLIIPVNGRGFINQASGLTQDLLEAFQESKRLLVICSPFLGHPTDKSALNWQKAACKAHSSHAS